jgi:hypothetical protein
VRLETGSERTKRRFDINAVANENADCVKSFCSLNAGPRKEMPTGRLSPVNPAGTIRSGKPVRLAMFVAEAVGLAGAVSGGAVSSAGLRVAVG